LWVSRKGEEMSIIELIPLTEAEKKYTFLKREGTIKYR